MASGLQRGNRGDTLPRITIWGGAGLLLMLPLVAMRFTDEVAWDGFDFAVFAGMLALAGGAFEVTLRMTRRPLYRIVIGMAVAALFVAAWGILAVG